MPKNTFKRFFLEVLTRFSSFSTLNGFYRQVGGVSMGSKLSCGLANIYLDILERDVIDKNIKNGNILHYCRYIDDILVVCQKNKSDPILRSMNTFHSDLKFTEEQMSEEG